MSDKASVYQNDSSLETVKFRVGGAIFTLRLTHAKIFAEALLKRVEEKQEINSENAREPAPTKPFRSDYDDRGDSGPGGGTSRSHP